MIAALGRNSRLVRVCCVLLVIFGLSSCHESTQGSPAAVENATSVESVVEKTVGTVVGDDKPGWYGRDAAFSVAAKAVPKSSTAARTNWPKDSYLEALRHSRTSTDPREGVVSADGSAHGNAHGKAQGNNRATTAPQRRREYVAGPVYTGKDYESSPTSPRIVYGSPDRDSFSMVPSDSYSLPSHASTDFHGPQHSYGPPQSQPPRSTYGPPSNVYPAYGDYAPSHQAYGPPAPIYGNGLPHGMSESSHVVLPTLDFSWPFALKLNAFTLAKILLKLVIFKMIVKFIAVICLLLFIPKLEIKKRGNKTGMNGGGNNDDDDDDDEDEGRLLSDGDPGFWDRLNALAAFVGDAADKYQTLNESRSIDKAGYQERQLQREEAWQDYAYLLRSYALEETGS